MSWHTTTIGSLVDEGAADIQTGPFGTQLKASDYVEEGTPVINVRNIGFGVLKPDKLEFITEETSERLSSHLLEPHDIVLGRKGAVNRHLYVTEDQKHWLQGSDCIRLRFQGAKVIPRYVSFAFLSIEHQKWMLAQSGNKATMASLNHDIIRRISLYIPPIATQEKIVDVLSAYDGLIENNQRRMALLEEGARQLYREWFVRLRFPGYEHAPVVKGVPRGWIAQLLDDLCAIGRGASPRPIANFMGGGIPWFKIGDATASESIFILQTAEQVTEEGANKSVALEPRSLILSNSATCGIPYFTGVRGCIHDGWLHFSGLKRISMNFLYCYLWFKREELVSSVGEGSTQKNLNTSAVGRLQVVLPAHDALLTQFDDFVCPVFDQLGILTNENQKLRAARDLLLPRLMSGEIAV